MSSARLWAYNSTGTLRGTANTRINPITNTEEKSLLQSKCLKLGSAFEGGMASGDGLEGVETDPALPRCE